MVQLRSYIFFFENAKNVGRSDEAKRRKKRGWPSNNECKVLSVLGQTEQVVGKLIKLWNPSQFGRNHVQIY